MPRLQILTHATSLALLIVCLVSCRQPTIVEVEQLIAGRTMGTTYSIKIVPFLGMPSISEVADAVSDELETVNKQMSTYDKTSEVSRFNDHSESSWFPVSPETATVVEASQRFSILSAGAFDATAAPLIDLWGFGPSGRSGEIPSSEQIAKVMKAVGFEKLSVQHDPPSLQKADDNLQIDLSAIAKGHGVDRVASRLKRLGFDSYFVEIGGEVITSGRKVDGSSWRIGVERPTEGERAIQIVLELEDCAIATSGDYRNVFRKGGQRFSHTIDVTTGRPVKNTIASATVVASTCMEADATATTLMAAGTVRGLALAEKLGWKVFLISRAEDGFDVDCSSEFREQFPEVAENLVEMSR